MTRNRILFVSGLLALLLAVGFVAFWMPMKLQNKTTYSIKLNYDELNMRLSYDHDYEPEKTFIVKSVKNVGDKVTSITVVDNEGNEVAALLLGDKNLTQGDRVELEQKQYISIDNPVDTFVLVVK